MEIPGDWSRTIIIVSFDGGQTPLEMVHTKLFVPVPMPFTGESGFAGEAITAVPEMSDHTAVPVTGTLPAREVVATQIF